MLTDNQVFFAFPADGEVGLAHFNDGDMIDVSSPLLTGYDLTTSIGPLTGSLFIGECPGADCTSFLTSAGVLKFSSVSAVTFEATVNPFRTISHIADGAGFRTTFILLNTGNVAADFTLAFWKDDGTALQLDLGADGVTAALTRTIPAHGSRFIRTSGSTVDLNKGWAQLNAPAAIDGNSIFGLQTAGQAIPKPPCPSVPAAAPICSCPSTAPPALSLAWLSPTPTFTDGRHDFRLVCG